MKPWLGMTVTGAFVATHELQATTDCSFGSRMQFAAGAFPFLRTVFAGMMFPGQLITVFGASGGSAMEGRANFRRKDREALRERWHLRAGQAFERMFGADNQDQLITFTQREDMACALAKELAIFLVEEHVAVDAQVRPSEKRPPGCPRCQQPGLRVTERQDALSERALTTGAGEVIVRREQWRCKKCRILFFSVRPQAGVGDGGLQSAGVGEGGSASSQGPLLQGGE
jgi:hypothetical protein